MKEFLRKTTYEVKTTERKGFEEIDIKEIVRIHEEEQDSEDGADAFDSDEDEAESDDYDSDEFTEDEDEAELTMVEDM